MSDAEMTLDEYRDLLDRRYRGESVALNAQEAARIRNRAAVNGMPEDRGAPFWLFVDPDGKVDGCCAYRADQTDTVDAAWKRFAPLKKTRQNLIDRGWSVRRDDDNHSGRSQLIADIQSTPTEAASSKKRRPRD